MKRRFKSSLLQVVIFGIVFAAGIMVGKLGFAPEMADNSYNQINVPNGQTYGSVALAPSPDMEPDLIEAVGVDGTVGYVHAIDFNGPMPKTPEEVVAITKNNKAAAFVKSHCMLLMARLS